MLRCNSDPCSSTTKFFQELVDKFEISSTPIVPVGGSGIDHVVDPNLDSMLVCVPIQENIRKEEFDSRVGQRKLHDSPSRSGLYRTPSLPPSIGRQELATGDAENLQGTGVSKLIRQSSLKNPPTNSLPPRITYKGTPRTSTTSRNFPRRFSRAKSMNMDKINQTSYQYLNHIKETRKSLSDLETEEVQGFKDLGFRFEEGDINPNVVDILPGLQENKRVDEANINVRLIFLRHGHYVNIQSHIGLQRNQRKI